jgi:hypothetical protein
MRKTSFRCAFISATVVASFAFPASIWASARPTMRLSLDRPLPSRTPFLGFSFLTFSGAHESDRNEPMFRGLVPSSLRNAKHVGLDRVDASSRRALRVARQIGGGPGSTSSFLGITSALSNSTPPDVQIAAGPGAIVEMVNQVAMVWTHAGAYQQTLPLSFFFGTGTDDLTDPQVLYDSQSGRWFASILDIDDSGIRLAVSATSDPVGRWAYYKLSGFSGCPDQPHLGMSDGIVAVAASTFLNACSSPSGGGSFLGAQYKALSKADLLAGGTVWACTSGFTSYTSIQPVRSQSSSSPLFMVDAGARFSVALHLIRLDGVPSQSAGCPAFSVRDVPIGLLSVPPRAEQPGAASLQTNDSRILSAAWQDGVVWATANDSCSPAGEPTRSCMRILAVRTDTGAVIRDRDVSNPGGHAFFPAVALDSAGNAIVTFGTSSALSYPSLNVATVAPDGTFNAATLSLRAGNGPETHGRFGDYFGAARDPVNPAIVWVAGEVGDALPWSTFVAGITLAQLAVPSVSYSTPSAIGVSSAGATLTANVNPQASDVTYHFEYGTTTSYGASTPNQALAAGSAFQPVSAAVTGLAASTTHHFRLVASNAGGSASGIDQTFTTAAVPTPTPPPPPAPTASLPPSHSPVSVVAQSASGVRGRVMRLQYSFGFIASDTNTYEVLTMGKYTIRTPVHHLDGDVLVKWRVPKNAPKQMKFCVKSHETAPYSGVSRDCAPIFVS